MSVPSNLSLGAIFRSAWDGIVEVFVRLRLLLLVGLLVYLVVGVLQFVVAADNAVLREALDVIQTILILPVEIAIYRLLVLGEASAGYASAMSTPRFPRMLGWTVVLWALMTLLQYLPDLITKSMGANVILTFAAVAGMIVLMVRLVILFPAIAVDAPGASLGNVWADTTSRSWLILKTILIVLVPLWGVLLAVGLIGEAAGLTAWWNAARDGAFEFLGTMAIAVVASRLFDWIGHRVKGLPA